VSPRSDFDVVVAGAGGAGCAAALAAADAGQLVLLLDHLPGFRRGCNTYMSTSMIPAAGTRWQRAAGVDDSAAVFYGDIMRKTKDRAYQVLARALTEVGPELVEWLADVQGLPLELATDFNYPGHSRHRCHTLPERSGHALHGQLMARVDAHPRIVLAAPMKLDGVDLDGEGRVAAAHITGSGGSPERVATNRVVLATGGFGGDHALVAVEIPEIAGALYFGSEGCTGDGLRIGQSLGADTGYLDAYQGHGSVATPHGIMVTWATVMHGAVLVNARGERFGDETTGYSEYAREVLRQPGGVAWVVLDARIDRLCRSFGDYQDIVKNQAARWSPGLAELAAEIGCVPGDLERTLAEAAAAAARGASDGWGRKFWEARIEPPYASIKVTGALFHTQGGLITDGEGAVLRQGRPIPGLYAAGGAAAGISGHGADGYLAGNGLLAALGLGYLAGQAVARASAVPS